MPIEQEEQTFPFMREVNKWEKEVMALNSQFVLLTEVVPNKKYVRISFLNLVPEVGRFLHDYALEDVRAYVQAQELIDPYWFVPRSPETRGESCPAPYSQNWDLFQAKALVLGEPAEKLQQYLQIPISWATCTTCRTSRPPWRRGRRAVEAAGTMKRDSTMTKYLFAHSGLIAVVAM